MLESVLANVLTQILGQYLHGIDRNSVSFGAWSGLVELRGVALRAEALSVLFETLGMDLPVTVEAGFIGLLRVVVPWKSIGSTPVKIEFEGVNIIARPVRDDGSDDSEIKLRERRIKRAKLNTDDAVREAAWSVSNSDVTKKPQNWSWLVSDDLLAKVVANIQIELRDLILRFEDPFSNSEKPYAVALHCDTLKAVSANDSWEQVFVEDISSPRTYKLLIVEGFRMDWLPLKKTDMQRYSNSASNPSDNQVSDYSTHEKLQDFFSTEDAVSEIQPDENGSSRKPCNLINPVNGSLRLSLARGREKTPENLTADIDLGVADALVDIRFPDISLQLDDVQYTSLVQTSLHFSKLSIRGYTPKTPKERWVWAVEQFLPGFRNRRARLMSFTLQGILSTKAERLLYIANRVTLLKSRRIKVSEPGNVAKDLETLEENIPFIRLIIYRDLADEQFEKDSAAMAQAAASKAQANASGTTMSYFWSRLGYETESEPARSEVGGPSTAAREDSNVNVNPRSPSLTTEELRKKLSRTPTSQVSFHLHRGSIRLSEGGYPAQRTPRVDLVLSDLIIGAKRYQSNGFLVEVLLGTVEAWDVKNDRRMVYARVPRSFSKIGQADASPAESSYPVGVADALRSIRSGFENVNVFEGAEDAERKSPIDLSDSDLAVPVHTAEEDLVTDGVYAPARCNDQSQDLAAWAAAASECTGHTTHRVTDAEFFGEGRDGHSTSLPYIAAFQLYRKSTEHLESKRRNQTQFVAAVGQLEAVVDGPKGTFIWAARFWSPKGLRKDPIMAFLGAAAGARIAALRMELEEALLADRLPLQVDALVRAPRFIVPGKTPASPAVVVNMGTLGVRTSENSEEHTASLKPQKSFGRYSNYALSLDDLGLYIVPSERLATSRTRDLPRDGPLESALIDDFVNVTASVKSIERLIRPLSLRLFVQVLRDPSTVQAVRGIVEDKADGSSSISKLKLRGQIPGLWVVLSQKSCKHLLSSAEHWNAAAAASPPVPENIVCNLETDVYPGAFDSKDLESSSLQPSIATLASYDCRIGIDHVSLELRDLKGQRLITAVASGMCATLVKTKLKSLASSFTLNSWTVTDGSRGSTAPFRRLAYAGTGSDHRGVSPPRSSSSFQVSRSRSRSRSQSELTGNEKNFVTIKHTLHFPGREQTINVHFLSLNLIFVRETVLKLTAFLEGMRETPDDVSQRTPGATDNASQVVDNSTHDESLGNMHTSLDAGVRDSTSSTLSGEITGGATFDGFRIQFVSGEGAICSVEMRDFVMRSSRDANGDIRATGDVRYFAVDDLTASIIEHQSFVRYERRNDAIQRMLSTTGGDIRNRSSETHRTSTGDGWSLHIPRSTDADIVFRTRLQDLRILYLARFSSVMSHYFSTLVDELRKSKFAAELEASALLEANQEHVSIADGRKSHNIVFEVDAGNVNAILPRHSGNSDEALVFTLPKIHVDNMALPSAGYNSRVRVSFSDTLISVQYRVPGPRGDSFIYTSPMGSKTTAKLELDIKDFTEFRKAVASSQGVSAPFIRARFSFSDSLTLCLCEAQYSVLYFVLTENLVEGIDEEFVSLKICASGETLRNCADSKAEESTDPRFSSDGVAFQSIAPISASDETLSVRKAPIVRLLFNLPLLCVSISRGWNVSDVDCEVFQAQFGDVSGNFEYGESELLAEVNSLIRKFTDLRVEEAIGTRVFAYPLKMEKPGNSDTELSVPGSLSFTYSKSSGHRPSIGITVSDIELKLIPELFRDMSHLAIPGWPFLPTSQFAPPREYLGRTMSVCFANSQVLLCADEFSGDGRGLILSGQFLTRIDWMRRTGAKSVSLQTTGLKIALEHQIEHAACHTPSENMLASRQVDRDALILYPCDSLVDYFGQGVDENGARIVVEAESMLCRLNVKDSPTLFAVLRRLARLEKSYLSKRGWKQPGLKEQDIALGKITPVTNVPGREAVRSADNVSLTYSAPASRILLTDQSGGRFVPVLELNFESILMEGTVPDLVQVGAQVSVNLFSRKKGWWEPGVEPWQAQASFSRGVSGSISFVLKSEDRLNLNVTPDTIQGAKEVLDSLQSVKVKADEFRTSSKPIKGEYKSRRPGGNRSQQSLSGPSVAAFHVRNELGLQVEMFVPVSSQRCTLLHGVELEVHVPVEQLLPPNRNVVRGNENNWRYEALKCNLSIPGYSSLELSAAEVGVHEVVFLSNERTDVGKNSETLSTRQESAIYAVWEISMVHGVSICTIRSLLRIVNETSTIMELSLCASNTGSNEVFSSILALEDDGAVSLLRPGEHYSIPVASIDRPFRIRPVSQPGGSDLDTHQQGVFGWSRPVNSWEWLKYGRKTISSRQPQSGNLQAKSGRSKPQQRASPSSKRNSARSATEYEIEHEVVRCECLQAGPDFFVAAVPECFQRTDRGVDSLGFRLDVELRAPLTFVNKLPGRVSYRISEAQGSDGSWAGGPSSITILGAGVIDASGLAHIYCTDDTQNLSGISVAFENTPLDYAGEALRRVSDAENIMPVNFGPFVPLSSLLSGQTKVLQASSSPRPELGETFHVSKLESRVPKFQLAVPFWFRNRSDTHLEICSRTSFYGKPSTAVHATGCPRGELAGRYLCLDGPYMSLRLAGNATTSQKSGQEWWTNPSDLRDISKPVEVAIPRRTLLLDVRQSRGQGTDTFVVTVRNAAFVVNNSDRCIQWCQTSVLDAHGNCPFRFLHFLNPLEEAPIHWQGGSNEQSIHIRLAESNGSSDWIWSPPLPVLLGNAGELSAKMYRPKSAEQYIARVLSAKLDGGASAVVVLSEDRQNPPYRIVNNCKSRSIAFNQVGSVERPWLVRPGRSTRYSWDDPLASANRRKLEVDVIDDHEASAAPSLSNRTAHLSDPRTTFSPTGGPSSLPPSRSFSKASSSRTSNQPLKVNIDIVNASPMQLGDRADLSLWYSVTMEGATKVLTFLDSNDESEAGLAEDGSKSSHASVQIEEENSVPVVLWDDLHLGSASFSDKEGSSSFSVKPSGEAVVPRTSDYPPKVTDLDLRKTKSGKSLDVDAAFYLSSAGVSIVSLEPVEIVYAHVTDLSMNFESYDSLECFSFQIRDFQVDNQLENPPYPVTLWAAPNSMPHQIQVELKRVVNDSGILMLKSVKAAGRPFNLMVDEDLIGHFLTFLNEIADVSYGPETEVLRGRDGEHENILVQMEKKGKIVRTIKRKVRGARRNGPEPNSSRRIYVEDLKLFNTKIVLSSSVSRGTLPSRHITLSPALRPFMAFLMNVENCEFEFPTLQLKHLFDSRTHFFSLIRQYYETQLGNQKMKLLTSNSLVGNPAALFDSVSTGAKDLLSEPGRGRSGGDFLFGVGRGSKSLITHTVGGIVGSISSIPQAVSTGLESAVADEAYIAERERIRGTQLSGGRRVGTSNPAQGAVSGFLSFAHGISSGVAGLVKDPVQGAMQGGASGFLKGVRKGLVGGVVKPVAGAIDLIAEPAAVISKQMNEADALRRRGGEIFAPQRPPRTFWGDSKRLVSFDMKTATGEELYKAVQKITGVSHSARLMDWIELSDRKERSDANAAEWVWGIVRQRTRAMGKSRRGSRFGESSNAQTADELLSQLRPEKTRIALLTEDHVLIVTLECKLLLTIHLWSDASFSLESNGKDLILVTRMGKEASREGGSSILAETQSLFAAPWDASTATKRRKPSPGEVVKDRIPCGSVAAREDLGLAMLKLVESVRTGEPLRRGRSFLNRAPSAIELPVLPSVMENENATELAQTRRSDAADGSVGVFVLPMRSPGGSPPTAFEAQSAEEASSTPVVERKSRGQLESLIRRLAMGGTHRAIDSERSIRIIVTNELESTTQLMLVRSSLDRGYWRVAVPQIIDPFEAVIFEVDSGSPDVTRKHRQKVAREVHGNVLFRAVGSSDQMVSNSPQVLLEFVNPSSGSPYYSTRTSGGLVASHERGTGTHATVVFRIGNVSVSRTEARENEPRLSSHALPGSSGSVARRLSSSKLFGSAMRLANSVQEARPGAHPRPRESGRPPSGSGSVDDKMLAQLLELGFDASASREALKKANGDIVKAVDILAG